MECSVGRSGRRAGLRFAVALTISSAVALTGSGLAPAGAHGTDPSIHTVLDTVTPELTGVTIQVAESVTAEVVVENTTATELAVLAPTGESFLRIGREGVHANVASPTWYLSNSPFGDAPIPDAASAEVAPQWVRVATEPSWGWFDHRLHPQPRIAPKKLPPAGESLRLARWSIRFEYGGNPVVARGRIVYEAATGAVTSRLRGPARPFEDVAVQLAPGRVPGLFASNGGTEPVIVLGAAGEPFLRIGPAGTEVNRRSPTWIDNARARNQSVEVDGLVADPAAAPDWSLLSNAPSTSWLEFRGSYPRGEPPRRVTESGKTKVLRRWSVPFERDGKTVTVRGETIWQPN